MILKRLNDKIKIYKDKHKKQLLLPNPKSEDPDTLTWDLSDEKQRKNFLSIKDNLWIEGYAVSKNSGDTGLQLTYRPIKPLSGGVLQDIIDTMKMTVVKVEISPCPYSWLPKGGKEDNEVEIEAKVYPSDLKTEMIWELYDVSDEKGYCINAPKNVPKDPLKEDSNEWKDLQFVSNQSGFEISGRYRSKAVTKQAVSTSKIRIKSYDYGAYGKLKVGIRYYKDGKTILGKNKINPREEYIPIPYDEKGLKDKNGKDKGNCIADYWEDMFGYGDPMDDNDWRGNGKVKGDGFTRYEEYRGVMINNKHEWLDPEWKEVFIRNTTYVDLDVYMFVTNFRIIELVSEDEFYNMNLKMVNFNSFNFDIIDIVVPAHGRSNISSRNSQRAVNITRTSSYTNAPQHGIIVVIDTDMYCPGFAMNLPGMPENGPPGTKDILRINTDVIDIEYSHLPTMKNIILAHECCHASNLDHVNEPCLMEQKMIPDPRKCVIVYSILDYNEAILQGKIPIAGFLCSISEQNLKVKDN